MCKSNFSNPYYHSIFPTYMDDRSGMRVHLTVSIAGVRDFGEIYYPLASTLPLAKTINKLLNPLLLLYCDVCQPYLVVAISLTISHFSLEKRHSLKYSPSN